MKSNMVKLMAGIFSGLLVYPTSVMGALSDPINIETKKASVKKLKNISKVTNVVLKIQRPGEQQIVSFTPTLGKYEGKEVKFLFFVQLITPTSRISVNSDSKSALVLYRKIGEESFWTPQFVVGFKSLDISRGKVAVINFKIAASGQWSGKVTYEDGGQEKTKNIGGDIAL